jgi:23S rRNA (uracil1939-C5)-methyltransferase
LNAICRHFGTCGGCAWQDLSSEAYLARKRELIARALARHRIPETSLREIISVPPRSRRRATLKVQKLAGETHIGFHAPRSHELVDIHECHVLTPGLFQLAQRLRGLCSELLRENESADLYIAEADNGFDLSISWNRKVTPELRARIAALAPKLNPIRITSGQQLLFETAVPEVTFGKARVQLPPKAFLQPTRDGERVLQAHAAEAVGKAKRIADLFSGCGTFSLPLAQCARIHAVDADREMLAALATGTRQTSGMKPVTTEARDLFKLPLTLVELARFDAVVLDPPRDGAIAQAAKLAKSVVPRIAYISCDSESFARDARVLIDGGFRLNWIVGVDQFLWSAHMELAAAFSRK